MKRHGMFVVGRMLFSAIVLFAGCASSDLVEIWSDASFQPPPMKKMLVIAAARNPARRRLWEDAFSSALEKHDVAATPSYRLFPDALPDTSQVLQSVQSNGFDGVLVTRRRANEVKTQYLQGSETSDQNVRYDRRNDRFETYYVDVASAGYIDSTQIDIRTIDVWSTRSRGHMIWSATSNTSEPNDVDEVRPKIAKLVMAELTQDGIISPRRK